MKIYLLAVLIVLSVLFCSCSGKLTPSAYVESELDPDGAVYLYTEFDTYAHDENIIMLFIHNNIEEKLIYGEGYELEVLRDKVWYRIPYRGNHIIHLLAYTLLLNETDSQEVNLKRYDYRFKDGQYRIIKEIGEKIYTAEFNITKN